MFSTDIDSRDFKLHKPEDVIKSVMNHLEKHGKGIILMHDFKQHTAKAMPELIRQLKAGGYKVVHMVPKGVMTTVPKYDEMLKYPRYTTSVVAGALTVIAPAAIGAADDTFVVAIASDATAAIAIANFEALIIIRPLVVSALWFCYTRNRERQPRALLKLVDP